MATWTGAAPVDSADLFRIHYPRLQAMRTDEVSERLDIAAFYYVTSSGVIPPSHRPLAVAHMAAHLLESSPTDGSTARAGGPIASRSNERGSQSYTTVAVGTFFGVAEHLLQETQGGRALLGLLQSSPSSGVYLG